MTKLYGIKNCDTMKKARAWLEANDVLPTSAPPRRYR